MTLLHIVLYNCQIDLSFVTSIHSCIEIQVSEGDSPMDLGAHSLLSLMLTS